MKHTLTIICIIGIFGLFTACTKAPAGNDNALGAFSSVNNSHSPSTMARLTGSGNSQPISVDTANAMLNSYLTGVGYPNVDTAVRSFNFDADTLRAYLQDNSIVTVKFMLAHNHTYTLSSNKGVNAGLNPSAMTMIVVGLNNDDHYVLNSRNQVYDHMDVCPLNCPADIGEPYIHVQ